LDCLANPVVTTPNGLFYYQVIWNVISGLGSVAVPSSLDYWAEPVNCLPNLLVVTPGVGENLHGTILSMGVS
jgi:hypothetical protein